MITRVNKTNRPKITNYIIKRLDTKCMEGEKKKSVSIMDVWAIAWEVEKKFNVSEYMSEKLTWEIIQEHNNAT